MDQRRLVLASTSPFRRELLMRLGLPFETAAPAIDETPLGDEDPPHLAERLAILKAKAITERMANALIIGSDQVAVLDGEILGKPRSYDRAFEQLSKASGNSVDFFTGVCLIDADSQRSQVEVVEFRVFFKTLKARQIQNYLRREQPYQCAGSFKSEGLGITLFERMQGDDPTSLIGLPLIRLTRMLQREGISVL